MAADWTRLSYQAKENCASVSCGHAPAAWRMEAGGVGSFYCEWCHDQMETLNGPSFTQEQILRRIRRGLDDLLGEGAVSRQQYDALYVRLCAPFKD